MLGVETDTPIHITHTMAAAMSKQPGKTGITYKDHHIQTECECIEVADSAKNLISKAVVRFPRETVIQQSSKKEKEVTSGDKSDYTEKKETLKDANNDGDVTTTLTALYTEDGISTT